MSIATVTSKGQVTIPKDVREDLGLEVGSRITFTRADNGEYVVSREVLSVQRLRGAVTYDGPPIGVEQMSQTVAEAASEAVQ